MFSDLCHLEILHLAPCLMRDWANDQAVAITGASPVQWHAALQPNSVMGRRGMQQSAIGINIGGYVSMTFVVCGSRRPCKCE